MSIFFFNIYQVREHKAVITCICWIIFQLFVCIIPHVNGKVSLPAWAKFISWAIPFLSWSINDWGIRPYVSPNHSASSALFLPKKGIQCKSLQALRLHVVSTFRVVLGNGIDYLVTVYIGFKIKRLFTLFPSNVCISVYCRHQWSLCQRVQVLFHLLVQTSRFLFYIPAIR